MTFPGVVARFLAAVILGLVLLILSSLLHAAAAATIGAGLPYLWLTWVAAIIAALAIALAAPSPRGAWQTLCLVNGLASAILFVACAAIAMQPDQQPLGEIARLTTSLDYARPLGAALGAAWLSGLLGIAAFALAAAFFAGAYGLLHWPRSAGSHAGVI